jgi:hypothetical protein
LSLPRRPLGNMLKQEARFPYRRLEELSPEADNSHAD